MVVTLGLLVWAALGLQLVLSVDLTLSQGRGIADAVFTFLGFYTILTNILVALALTAPRLLPASAPGRFFARPRVATGVAVAITVVGIAYAVLLRQVWDPEGWQLVADIALHYASPVLFVAYWWVAVPKHALGWSDIPWQLLYPLGYLAYSLVRGASTGRYPYYFLDPGRLGYAQTFANAAGMTLFFLLVAAGFVALARAQRRH
jgi:hypothetical protein